jgi:imidazolonepropionase-like amidohydrolase
LRGGVVFDGSDAAPSSGDVVVEGGRIIDVGSGLDGDEELDCTGCTVYPGFIDSHVHFMIDGDLDLRQLTATPFSLDFFLAAERMARTLSAGVTTVREAGGTDLGVKEAQRRGLVPGPHLLISISILSQTGGHGDGWQICGGPLPIWQTHPGRPHNIVDGPEEMRRKVRELVRSGADVIKVCTSGGVLSARDDPRHAHFRDDELSVAVAEAAAAGRWVMAHAQATDGIKAAVRNGIRSIEHGVFLDDEAIEMMLDRGTYLVPTLLAPIGVLEAADRGGRMPSHALAKARLVVDAHRESVSAAAKAGVKIAMGTDAGVAPHGENLRELPEMVACGMSPSDALIATTRTAAELLGVLDDRGTVEPGKRADLVVATGEPLDVGDLTSRIRHVLQDGRVVK